MEITELSIDLTNDIFYKDGDVKKLKIIGLPQVLILFRKKHPSKKDVEEAISKLEDPNKNEINAYLVGTPATEEPFKFFPIVYCKIN